MLNSLLCPGIPRWPLPERFGQGLGTKAMDAPELMTVGDFLARYSIGRTTAYREVAAGRLKMRKLGTATRIARTDAEAWADSLPSRTGAAT